MSDPFDLGLLDRRVLFSGAGLSRNWGGYLVREMWGAILSDPEVQQRKDLRQLLLREMNFEVALAEVQLRTDKFDESSRRAMEAAVRAAFKLQDANNCQVLTGSGVYSWNGFSEGLVRLLVGKDQHRPELTSFSFTLNQDILFERGFSPPTAEPPNMPGIPSAPGFWIPRQGIPRQQPYSQDAFSVQISGDIAPALHVRERLNYIKLHGSFNWDDGKNAMLVLGGGKRDALSRFPLLQAYFDLFRHVLMVGDINSSSSATAFTMITSTR